MNEQTSVTCVQCEIKWVIPREMSVYEREAREADPCPGCRSHTLRCERVARPRMRRATTR